MIWRSVGILIVILACTGCFSKSTEKSARNLAQSAAPAASTGGCVSPSPTGVAICQPPTPLVAHIGDNLDLGVPLRAGAAFSGDLDLSIDRSASGDNLGGVSISLARSPITVAPGELSQIQIHVDTDIVAASGTYAFTMSATVPGAGDPVAVSDLVLEVQPIFDVFIFGGGPPEFWFTGYNPPWHFARHTELTFVFHNMDQGAEHTVRGGGDLPAFGTPLEVSPADNVEGGNYRVAYPGSSPLTGSFYCATHESAADARSALVDQP